MEGEYLRLMSDYAEYLARPIELDKRSEPNSVDSFEGGLNLHLSKHS
jgi:hypothetical protein